MDEQNNRRPQYAPRRNMRHTPRDMQGMPISRGRSLRPSNSVQPQAPTPYPAPQPIAQQQPAPASPSFAPNPVQEQIQSPVFAAKSDAQESQAKPRIKLPLGVYVVAALVFMGFVGSFFNTSRTSTVSGAIAVIELLLVVGLLMRKNLARMALIGVAGISIVVAVVTMVTYVNVQQGIKQDKVNYQTAVNHLNEQKLTEDEKRNLGTLQIEISKKQKQIGQIIVVSYGMQAAAIVESIIIIIYLTRPKVKSVFSAT